MQGLIRGVDFGTSTSLLSESTSIDAEIISIGQIDPWMASVVGLDGQHLAVGDDALLLPEPQVLRSVKRTISRHQDVVRLSNGDLENVLIAADDAIRSILDTLRDRAANEFASLTDDDAVVRLGCPAMWTGEQRRRLLRLANEAGLPVGDATLIDEPIAAGVAWISQRLRNRQATRGKVLVFDMGGGTLDIAVLNVEASPGHEAEIAVQSALGIDRAGDSLDEALLEVARQGFRDIGFDVEDFEARGGTGWLSRAVRRAKIELTEHLDTPVNVDHPTVPIPVIHLSRERLEDAFQPQLDEALNEVWGACRAALMSQVASRTDARTMSPSAAKRLRPEELAKNIDYVLLVGGMSRIPLVRDRFGEVFGDERIYLDADPTTTVARGLGESRAYEGLNLHRPGFDFVVDWESDAGPQSETVYEAYTPLYDLFQVVYTDSVKYSWRPRRGALPTMGEGIFRARSVGGENIPLVWNDAHMDGVRFRFGRSDPYVSLEPNGRIFLRDGFGAEHELFIDRWPVIRGRGFEAIVIRSSTQPAAMREWYYDQSGD